jgi:Domain of unknown function (DUF4159)
MAVLSPEKPAPPAPPPSAGRAKHWTEKISRSGYFFGAVLLHLILFVLIGTWVIFPAFHPPSDDFQKTYVPASSPPPPPPPQQTVQVSTHTVPMPTTAITAPSATTSFSVPLPDISPSTTPVSVSQKLTQKVVSKVNDMSEVRLAKIMETEKGWGRDKQNIMESNGDPKNITAKFPVYLAKYADGDWSCNVELDGDGNIAAGSLPNLVAKINEWSHGHISGNVVPEPLDIGGPELLDKKPPFIFFTGHKDFTLTDDEIQNLRDYLQVGGCIWGDNTLAGHGSRFDVAFRREMKRVVPDKDKNFEPVDTSDKIFTASWYPMTKLPPGMNFYQEPIEHLDIDGKLAILYTPNDYGDMFQMQILPGDDTMGDWQPDPKTKSPLHTNSVFLFNRQVFFRNFELPSCLASQQLGMNIVGYLLVRFDDKLLLTP